MHRGKGLFYIITGAVFWGIGGTVAKKLFQHYGVDVNWFVAVRLLLAGVLLLSIQGFNRNRGQIWSIWTHWKDALRLLIFGLIGMLAVQYTYMASIKEGNAAVATLLQYLSPVMIIGYLFLSRQAKLTPRDGITVSLALAGCFLLLTNGSFSQLSVPTPAIVWGILSGVAAAFYTLYAIPLLKKFDSLVIVGWSMVIGGSALSLIHPPWRIEKGLLTGDAYLYLAFVILFGTMLAFWFYVESLNYLAPKETSLLGSLEPLAAVITTVFWLHDPFGLFQWIGAACILIIVAFMAADKPADSTTSTTG